MDILEAVATIAGAIPVVAAVGPSCPVDRLSGWERAAPRRRFVRDTDALPGLISGASLVVSGGGTTLWETYCIGRPSVAVVWVENQRQTLEFIGKNHTSIALDARSGLPIESLMDAVRQMIAEPSDQNRMVRRQREVIDGAGAVRVAAALTPMMKTG